MSEMNELFDMSQLPPFQPALVRNVAVSSLKRAYNPEKEDKEKKETMTMMMHDMTAFLSTLEPIMVEQYFSKGDQELFDQYIRLKDQMENWQQHQQQQQHQQHQQKEETELTSSLFSFQSNTSPRFALELSSSESSTIDHTASTDADR